jgi:S-adenosylmethionine decarboxylase
MLLLAIQLASVAVSSALSQRIGTHFVLELWGVDAATLDDAAALERALRDASAAARLTVLETAIHRFEPQGVTGLLLLSESHISVHTWPELGYAAVDLFSCGAREELPCSESAERSGGGGEVTMYMRRPAAAAATEEAAVDATSALAGWTCADGTAATAPSPALGERSEPLKDLWAAVDSLSVSLRPRHIQLRHFERGVPATRGLRDEL